MKRYLVRPGSRLHLSDANPDDHHFLSDKDQAKEATPPLLQRIDDLQERMYAGREHSLLIVLQGMDTAGKDGTIRHVMNGVNPQGCQVSSFKVPTPEEKAHDFLWRVHAKTPARGYIGIFNRSHYEDVLVTRVHGLISDHEADRRMKEIRRFEKLLAASGTTILKFFLHISKDEQRRRLEERIDDRAKQWKLSLSDLAERKKWKAYQKAYEEAISETSTEEAPWYVVPSNHRWYRNWVAASLVLEALEAMDLKRPRPEPGINFKKLKV